MVISRFYLQINNDLTVFNTKFKVKICNVFLRVSYVSSLIPVWNSLRVRKKVSRNYFVILAKFFKHIKPVFSCNVSQSSFEI